MTKQRIEVCIGGEWTKVRTWRQLPRGWVEYQTYDDTVGMTKNWRITEPKHKPESRQS